MTLDSRLYGDPARILERKQEREIQRREGMERVCTGCVHKRVIWMGEEKHKACALKRGFSPTIFCNHYLKENE